MECREAGCLEFSLWEGAFDTIMKSISDDAFLVKNLAVGGDVRVPGALRSVSFANPRTKGYVQQKNGARCCSSEYFRA